jgi:hypothetical protein
LGSTHSLWQALSSAVKLPLLFLATLIVCAPTLYFFNLIFGSNQRLSQNIAIMLTAITVTAVVLLSFAPIVLFFLLTCAGSPHFYRLEAGRKRWIVDIHTFEGQGYVWQDVRAVDCTYLYSLPDGESIPPGRGSPPEP